MSFGKTFQLGRANFVGRVHEMDLLRQHVKGDWLWRWLHIYGQSGIGKSTLLKRFMTETEAKRRKKRRKKNEMGNVPLP